jgi:hypothetical protein
VNGELLSRGSTLLASVLVALLTLLVPPVLTPSRAEAASLPAPAAAVALLNAWRTALELRPVVHDEVLSRGCRKHAEYFRLNPTHYLHGEVASAAGFTEAGDLAARSSVLAFGNRGADAGISAWEPAPYHRMALLDPRLAATGFWSEFGLTCMQAAAVDHDRRTPELKAYTYPIAGQRDVATTFWCDESPNPCDVVRRTDTLGPVGTNISIQFNGPWLGTEPVSVTAASVAAAGRPPVDLTVQTRGSMLRGGILLIPRRPLRAGTTYGVSVTGSVPAVADDGTKSEHPYALSWDFSTPGIDPAASLKVVVERVTRTRVHLRLNLLSREAREARISLLSGTNALLRVTRRISGPTQRVSLPRPPRRVTRVAVLLRGSDRHIGVAARIATDIKARAVTGASAARR